ncbi:tyrosine-type recombinase/integrase [Methanoregula sp.]|uniref:tyrosine-type recombinase/integrase n=1 Tax=Methanoregula sp. TaxID=2052170 RepID=UPI003C75F3BB
MAATNSIQVSRFHPATATLIAYSGNVLTRGIAEGRITEDDANLIREFIAEISATRNISSGRAFKLHYTLVNLREYLGPYRQNTVADIYTAIDRVRNAKKENGTPRYKQNSISDFVRFLKRFYLWMCENHYTTIEEKKIEKIRPPAFDTMTKTPEMLLTEEEIRVMIESCMNSRDRAIIATLYEGGFRIGEIAALKWKDVNFTDWNATITTSFKTGKSRTVPLVMARSYLASWRNDYPLTVSPDSFVFLTNKKAPLGYAGIAKQLRVIATRAGVTKHITPHIFRHTRATHLIRQGYGEAIVKKLLWGNLNSKMFSTYLHLVDSDVERVIAEKAGVAPRVQRSKALESRQCPRCYTINGPTIGICRTCGFELTEEAINKVNQSKEQAELQPEFQAILDRVKGELLQMQAKNQA